MDILSLFGAPSGLLSTLYPTASAVASPSQAVVNLDTAERQIAEREASGELPETIARDPGFKRDMERFREAVAGAKSVEALVKDPTVQKVLTAIAGLGDQSDYSALVQQALLSDLSDPESVANQLGETNAGWETLAGMFDLANTGLSRITDPIVLSGIEQDYAETLWRLEQDKTTPGLSAALAFKDRAGAMKDYYELLGDSAVREVVTKTLGLPLEIALQPIETQAAAVEARLDLKDLQDPKFVESFMQRYLIAVASENYGIYV